MAEFDQKAAAQAAYATLCQALDSKEIRYTSDAEKMILNCVATGDDLPIDITIHIDAGKSLIVLVSRMPFVAPEDKRMELAIAASVLNAKLGNGNLDYDIRTGKMFFRMTNSFFDCQPGTALFLYMLYSAWDIIDECNDKLLMLAKGMLTLDKFLASFQD